jgi:hypothetical protein
MLLLRIRHFCGFGVIRLWGFRYVGASLRIDWDDVITRTNGANVYVRNNNICRMSSCRNSTPYENTYVVHFSQLSSITVRTSLMVVGGYLCVESSKVPLGIQQQTTWWAIKQRTEPTAAQPLTRRLVAHTSSGTLPAQSFCS